jgi:shikimate kinase
VGGDPNRPLWKNAAELFEQRQNTYRKAHFEIDASASPESVAEKIKSMVLA